jgi:hypothetical protein
MFDDSCKKCGAAMQPARLVYYTQKKPFATFACATCKIRLMLFEAPITPLLVWSDNLVDKLEFSDAIEKLIKERQHKIEVRARRYGEHPASS